MKLDKHVVDMFTELTKPADDVKMEKTCYGTISVVDGTRYVKLDGSDLLVPAASTVKTSHGDRVTVLMKNHSLTVTGNLTAPATDGEGGSSGEAGTAATIEVGTVTTGEAGSSASVINSGTTSAAVFDFVIPRGDKGEKGDTGPQGPQGEKGDTGTWDGTIPDHEHTVSDITDFPTSLPANGGNADTVDGKHAGDFFNNIADLITPESSGKDTLLEYISSINSFTSNFYASGFDDLPTNNWGYNVTVYKAGGAVYVIAYRALSNHEIYIRDLNFSGEWNGDWTRLNDGGNADTVDGKHAGDFVQKSGDSMSGNLRMETNQLWFGVGGTAQFYFENTNGDINLKNHDGATVFAANYLGSYTTHADTLDGKHAESFTQWLDHISDVDFLNNANYKVDYHCNISDGTPIGLPIAGWYHIVYYMHTYQNGYGMQIAYPLNFDGATMIRRANGTTWGTWKNIADGGNADTLGNIPASELERVRTAIIAGEAAGFQWTAMQAKKDDTIIRVQVDADYDRVLLFKSIDGGVTWTEIPLGNANTVGSLPASSFLGSNTNFNYHWANGAGTQVVSIFRGENHIFAFNYTDTPTAYGFLDVSSFDGEEFAPAFGLVRQVWTDWSNPSERFVRIYRATSETDGVWTDWSRCNAASVGVYTEAKLTELEARIAALEGGTT